MLKYGLFGIIAAVIAMGLGISLLLTEQSPIRWMGLLAILGGTAIALRSWAALSIHAEETTGQQPVWHIKRVFTSTQH